MAESFTYSIAISIDSHWECQTSTGVGALGMDGIGSSACHAWRPISPSLNFCNFSFKRKVNEYRMYDPVMSTFLSVDAYVQDPTSAQGFNRYAYCSHNPLRYVDPTGWSNQPFGNPNVAPPCNPIKHTTYSSDDPNDMLWGYSHHPCSSGGQCNGANVTCTKITEGNGSNYTVSTTGYVTNVGSNGLNYDMLYTEADWEAGDLSNGLRVNDMSILSQLTVARSDYGTTIWEGEGKSKYEPGHYAATENKDEAEPNIHKWYKIDNNCTIFPKHYVYNTSSHTLYYYTPFKGQSSIYIRSINLHKDLYRNLGF